MMQLFRKYPVLLAGLLIATISQGDKFVLPTTSTNTIRLAQTPAVAKIPTAGAILGWELNMNHNYSQKLEREMYNQPRNTDESPVIFFENTKNKPVNEEQFLLNTPKPNK